MSKNFVTLSRSGWIVLLFAFLLFLPTHADAKKFKLEEPVTTENNESLKETTTSVLESELNAEVIKKKDKVKEKIELNPNFYISLGVDLLFLLLIIGLIYYPNYRRLDTIFTFVLFNVSIFLLTFLLNKIKISMGAAFGLFAVFSMLRYRTAGISVKDMTYLFLFIAMGLLSGIQLDLIDLMVVFGIIFVFCFLLDTKILLKRESTKLIHFENIDLIHVDKQDELMEELKKRTGLNIHRISVDEISYLRDSADITIYFYE